jgi:hypothetical protein
MTPEQQREQLLKRVLPALVVLVVYFAIISGFVTDKSKNAQQQYQALKSKGIDPAALQGMGQQQQVLRTEVAALEAENKAARETLQAKSGFLSRTGTVNDTLAQIGAILAKNSLQVLEEKQSAQLSGKEILPKSIGDTQRRLKEIAAGPADNLNIWTIHYVGNYLDNYRALSSLAGDDAIKALPVSLTMQPYKSTNDSDPAKDAGKQEWLLTLWL